MLILKNKAGIRFGLQAAIFSSYITIFLKQLFAVKILRLKLKNEKIFGYRLNFFDYNDFVNIFEEIFIQNDYFFRTSNNNPVIIDCGSNIGLSVIYFKLLYPGSKITAFEAHSPTFSLLKQNIENNNIKDITLINKALHSKKNKKIWFYSNESKPGALGMTVIAGKPGHNKKEVVITDTLSSYITFAVDFIKMDIEGAENEVIPEIFLKGRQKFMDLLIIEYHHHLSPSVDKFGSMLNCLEKNHFGYTISTWTKPPFKRDMEHQDILIYAYKKNAKNI